MNKRIGYVGALNLAASKALAEELGKLGGDSIAELCARVQADREEAERRFHESLVARASEMANARMLVVNAKIEPASDIDSVLLAFMVAQQDAIKARSDLELERSHREKIGQALTVAEREVRERTNELRRASERGVERQIERVVAMAREEERSKVADDVANLRIKNEALVQEIDALRAAKKRLREALERSKQGR